MSLSRQDIIEYKTTNDNSRKNEIEMNVIDDDFQRDSLDGWSQSEVSINQLKSLDRKVKFNFRFKLVLLSISAFIIASISLILINSIESNEQKIDKDKSPLSSKTNLISKDSVKSFQELPQKLQIKPSKIKADFEDKEIFVNRELINPTEIDKDSIRLPIKNPEKINNSISKRENIAKVTFLNDLKVIDYRFYRSRSKESIKNELGGTPADKELRNNNQNNSKSENELTYFSYLEKSLRYFSKNKFKTALNRFEMILETYPDDANALFYGAICLYNLNQLELCENRLMQLENSRYTNFDQEQQWYLLLVYKSLGRKSSFDNLKEKIILENGFYSKTAKDLEY
jgi:hypothetical protein